MERQSRIKKMKQFPAGTMFLVVAPNGLYWRQCNVGYTEDISEARVFSKEEIITKLEANGLMDKNIEVFISKEQI